MRIAFLSASGQLGGAERLLVELIAGLSEARPSWDIHLVTAADGPLVARAAAAGAHTHVLLFPAALARVGDAGNAWGTAIGLGLHGPASLAGSVRYVRALRRLLRQLAPDLVHCNGFKMDLLGVWARPAGVPVVWHLHDFVTARPLMARLLRLHAGRCAFAITNSDAVRRDAEQVLGSVLRLHVVWNGIDVDAFTPEGPGLDLDRMAHRPGPPAGSVRVGLVATMGLYKGHDVFLRAVAALRGEPFAAYVVGGRIYETDGSQVEPDSLTVLARTLGVDDIVAFTGLVADPAAAMRTLDVVVHATTRPEPFGLVIAEAMACARPVVVSAAGGAAEIIEDGTDALGFTPGDSAALAERLRTLVRDPALRARLGAAGRRSAVAKFDRRRMAEQIAVLHEQAVA
jgi:glycosyltransferase involved in cell wall biosynthesis